MAFITFRPDGTTDYHWDDQIDELGETISSSRKKIVQLRKERRELREKFGDWLCRPVTGFFLDWYLVWKFRDAEILEDLIQVVTELRGEIVRIRDSEDQERGNDYE